MRPGRQNVDANCGWAGAALLLVLAGCGRPEPQSRPTAKPNSGSPRTAEKSEKSEKPGKADQSEAEGDRLFVRLTSNTWTNYDKKALQAEGSVLKIFADGKYSLQFFSDYDTRPTIGRWNLEYRRKQWFLIYDNGRRWPIRFDEKGQLRLGTAVCWKDEPLPAVAGASRRSLPKVQLQAEPASLKKRLTVTVWTKANDLDVYRLPAKLELREDWSYRTVYRGGQCRTAGEWGFAIENGKLQFAAWSPASKCDTRGEGTEHLGGRFATSDSKNQQLLVNGALYIPETASSSQAVVWNLCNYSNVVRIEMRYKLPLRAKQPNQLELTFHSHPSQGPIVLQRFSVTREYNRKYRISKTRLSRPAELAGIDLKGHVLKSGEVHQVSLPVVFPESGTHMIYFNTFMYGTTQTWDTQGAWSVTIK